MATAAENLHGRIQLTPEQFLHRVFPDLFKKLNDEQVAEFCELAQLYARNRDPDTLETMTEILAPDIVGTIVFETESDPGATASVYAYQRKVGDQIRSHRVKRGWTQAQLAVESGLRQSHLSRLEKGTHTPTDLTIEKLSRALGVSAMELDPGID